MVAFDVSLENPRYLRVNLRDYFDRVSIIHLPERVDRFESISRELRSVGLAASEAKVTFPHAEKPADANDFPSRGVYGNFLSHLDITRSAHKDGLRTVWVLEDDAIFSRCLIRNQGRIVEYLRKAEWDLCFFGHSVALSRYGPGFVRLAPDTGFMWAHCYAVHVRVMPRLIDYFQRVIETPRGHPAGGKMYIDGAFNLFRRFNPDVVTLAANPALSRQKGCRSSLASPRWYDNIGIAAPIVSIARNARDHWWKLTSGSSASFPNHCVSETPMPRGA